MVADGGRVLTNGQVKVGTCEGREVTVALPNRSTGREGFAQARVFTSGQRYYFMIFVSERDGETTRQVGRTFMDSFSVRGGCTRAVAPRLTISQAQVQPFVLFHHEYLHEAPETFYSAEIVGEYPAGFYNSRDSYENLLDATFFVIKRNLGPLAFNYAAPRKLNVGAYPGREYIIESAQAGASGRIQVYATPKRAYVFIYISRAKKSPDADLERFFSSIRISVK
jgi:hypothetical protein